MNSYIEEKLEYYYHLRDSLESSHIGKENEIRLISCLEIINILETIKSLNKGNKYDMEGR